MLRMSFCSCLSSVLMVSERQNVESLFFLNKSSWVQNMSTNGQMWETLVSCISLWVGVDERTFSFTWPDGFWPLYFVLPLSLSSHKHLFTTKKIVYCHVTPGDRPGLWFCERTQLFCFLMIQVTTPCYILR